MRRVPLLIMLIGLLFFGGVAQAQIVSPFHILPVVAKVAGAAGTDWMTSLSISNVSDTSVNVTATFYKENTNHAPFMGPSHGVTIGAGRTLSVNDVLGDWFPNQGNTKGFLILMAEAAGGGDANLAVTGRVFNNANPNATYGQSIASNLLGFIFGTGSAVLTGARWDNRTRSNIGVINLSVQPLDLIITTYGANGAVVASVSKQVNTFSMAQWSLTQLGVSNLTPGGRVEVMVDPDSITWDPCDPLNGGFGAGYGMFMTYISRVDQATGDAEFAFGQSDWTRFEFDCGYLPDDGCPRPGITTPNRPEMRQ